jgi:hypothetical protein
VTSYFIEILILYLLIKYDVNVFYKMMKTFLKYQSSKTSFNLFVAFFNSKLNAQSSWFRRILPRDHLFQAKFGIHRLHMVSCHNETTPQCDGQLSITRAAPKDFKKLPFF